MSRSLYGFVANRSQADEFFWKLPEQGTKIVTFGQSPPGCAPPLNLAIDAIINYSYNSYVLSVATAVLKNRLSFYLKKVRNGVPILVTDRGTPIAKIIPFSAESLTSIDEAIAALIAEGIAEHDFRQEPFKKIQKLDLGEDLASKIVIEDRD